MEEVEDMYIRKLAVRNIKTRPRTQIVTEDEKSMRFFYDLFPDVPVDIAEKAIGFSYYPIDQIS